jgi:thioredoxin-related protein
MKTYLIAALALLTISTLAFAQKKKTIKKVANKTTIATSTTTTGSAKSENEIEWLTWEEAQKRMAVSPKKVYVDIYTDWCGWCKVMEKKTFTNKHVIKYINDNFYAIRFNSEKDDNITFKGKLYTIKNGFNELAVELMRGAMSYPTSIFFEENFANPQPVPGYLDIKNIQPILNYLGGNHQKTTPYQDYQKAFVITWE